MSTWNDGTPIDSVTRQLRTYMCAGYEEKKWAAEYLFNLFMWLIEKPRNLDSVRSRLDRAVAEMEKRIGQRLAFERFIAEAVDGVVVAAAEQVRHNNPYYGRLLSLFVTTQVSV